MIYKTELSRVNFRNEIEAQMLQNGDECVIYDILSALSSSLGVRGKCYEDRRNLYAKAFKEDLKREFLEPLFFQDIVKVFNP